MPAPTRLDNGAIAERLEAFAALLDLSGASIYSARAYRRAAELVRGTPVPVEQLVREGRVRELRGIGAGIEARLRELVETGRIAELDELERTSAPELVAVARLVGLAPARLLEIGETLGVRTAAELREAGERGELERVPGVGPRTAEKLRERLAAASEPRAQRGLTLNRARELTGAIADALGGMPAGDARRFRDVSERLAVVVAADDPRDAVDRFTSLPQVVAVLERGDRRAVGVTVDGVPVELLVPPTGESGTALVRATGSEEWVRELGALPAGDSEEAVFDALGQPYVPPELREEGAPAPALPLVELANVRGDLHCHTTWSDGRASVLEMGETARDLGYEYLAICDHTEAVRVVPGLDADALRRQGEEIAAANEELRPFRVLRGAECDILPDGSLDLPDDVLGELDWVQVSVHAGQRTPRPELTARVLEALRHPAARCLSHPKGRIIGRRPENELDLDAVWDACVAEGVAVEVNGLPDRLDLRDAHVRAAVTSGVAVVVSTDAHSVRGLSNMLLAVGTARRGGATAGAILNTRPLEDVLGFRAAARSDPS